MDEKGYFNKLQEELIAKKNQFPFLAKQSTISGRYSEEIVIDFLKDRVKGLKIGTGIIVMPEKSSNQCDIIIYDDSGGSPIFKSGNLVILEPKSVRVVIEVKSGIITTDVIKAQKDFTIINDMSSSICCCLFGFGSGLTIEYIQNNLSTHEVALLTQNKKPVEDSLYNFIKQISSKCSN